MPMTTMGVRTILVGLDGSPEARGAIELSLRWARATGARLVGLGIVDEPTIRHGEPVPMGASYYKHERDEWLVAEARQRVEEFLDDFTRACAEHGLACEVLEKGGLPHEQIVRAAPRHDLVVLPRRSHFHFETEHGADDTVERVLRQCVRPVALVPKRLEGAGPVVVAYDGGVHVARALQAFQASGLEAGAEVLVASVHEDEREAQARAEEAVAFLASHDIAARPAALVTQSPAAEAILDVAHQADARLLVAGIRSGSRLAEMFFGSVMRDLLRGVRIPLLLYS